MESDRDPRLISRRKFLTATAATLGSLTLAACGGQGGAATEGATTGSGDPAAGTAAPGGASEATAAPEGAAAEPTVAPTPTPVVLGTGANRLVYWHGLGGADGATLVTMLQQYAQAKPDVTISSETYDWGVFYQKMPTATAAGTPPAMATMHSWGIPQFTDQGILQDADSVFFQPGLIPKDDFPTALIEAISIDGVAMGVPFDNHGWINWVNTKVIEDAGLDPNALPTNGTEYIEWAQKIVVDDAGKHPNEEGFNPDRVQVWANHTAWQKFTLGSTIHQYGGGIFSQDGKTAMLTDPKTVAAVQYWHDLIYKHHVVPPVGGGVLGPMDLFATNAIATAWDGTWNLNFFKDNPEALAVMKPMPLNSLAPDGKLAARYDSHMHVVPVGVEDPSLSMSKDLIKYLSDSGETWATSGQVPARLSVQAKPAVQEIESVKVAGESFAEFGVPGEGAAHPAINEILQAYEAAFSALLSNTTPVQEALSEANTTIQSILDRG